MSLENKPFIIKVIIEQVVDNNLLLMKAIKEFAYGKDIMPTLANAFNEMKKFVEKKLLVDKSKDNEVLVT